MITSKRNKSVVTMLRDRELNVKCAPYFSSLKIASELIRSDKQSLYTNFWTKSNSMDISYSTGNVYFSNYEKFSPINAFNKNDQSPFILPMEQSPGKKNGNEVISYSGKYVFEDMRNICHCEPLRCTCLSQYLISISDKYWLCQHLVSNGKLLKQFYINRVQSNVSFGFCDWDVYGDRFTLNSGYKSGAIFNIAVFTTFPLEFFALMEIKHSVFGKNITNVTVSNQSLFIVFGRNHVAIYNFNDFLDQGTLTPYKFGDVYENEGVVGCYPTGLPLNFTYNSAPPVLLRVKCYDQVVHFGGYPYHYIADHCGRQNEFRVTVMKTETFSKVDEFIFKSHIHLPTDRVMFHPDQSNRLILTNDHSVDFYKIIVENGKGKLLKLFSIGQIEEPTQISSFGRTIRSRIIPSHYSSVVLCSDYEAELKIFAILAKRNAADTACVKLYDSVTGENLRTIELRVELDDRNYYEIHIDLFAIIIIESNMHSIYSVFVYIM